MTDDPKIQIDYVSITDIEQHPDNPNMGDLDAIAESIDMNGLYAPLTVQRSTGYILAGNHRYMVLISRGIAEVPVVYLDVDEPQARRIMLADNRTTRLGHDDPGLIAELLESLASTDEGIAGIVGTGYSESDYLSILEAAEEPLDLDAVQRAGQDDDSDVPDSQRFQQRFWVEPEIDADEKVYVLKVTRIGGKPVGARDMNTILKALGMPPKTADELGTEYGVPAWGGNT